MAGGGTGDLFECVETFFLVESNGHENRLHGVVIALIGGGLCVTTRAVEEPIKVFLVFAAERAAELRPACGDFVHELAKCRNRTAHRGLLQSAAAGSARLLFSQEKVSDWSCCTVNFQTRPASASSAGKKLRRPVTNEVASEKTATAIGR